MTKQLKTCPNCKSDIKKLNRRCPVCKFYLNKPHFLKEKRNKQILKLLQNEANSLQEVADKFGVSKQLIHQLYQREIKRHYLDARRRKEKVREEKEKIRLNSVKGNCVICNKPILVKERNIKYCSEHSYMGRERRNHIKIKCDNCSIEFHPRKQIFKLNSRTHFCTWYCRNEFRKTNPDIYFGKGL